MSYAELLRDPRWQKKRLEIMERDGFVCQICASKTNTLTVHHLYYEKGRMPWDYQDESLVTLCVDCHQAEQEGMYDAQNGLICSLRNKGYDNGDLEDLATAFLNCKENPHTLNNIVDILRNVLLQEPILKYLNTELSAAYNNDPSIFAGDIPIREQRALV